MTSGPPHAAEQQVVERRRRRASRPTQASPGRHLRRQRMLRPRARAGRSAAPPSAAAAASASADHGELAGVLQGPDHHGERLGRRAASAPAAARPRQHWWRPPPGGSRRIPRSARIPPPREQLRRPPRAPRRRSRLRAVPSGVANQSRGPHAGQLLVSEWCRRSPGVSYSTPAGGALREGRHAGALAVVGHRLDDGEARPAVGAGDERVPEPAVGGIVQLAPRRPRRSPRPAGPAAGGRARPGSASMAKPREPGSGAVAPTSIRSMRGERRRLDAERLAGSRCSESGAPSSSICTSPAALRTQPSSSWRTASRCTKGRKPTPCTTPVTRTREPFPVVRPGRGVAPAAGESRTTRRAPRR